MDTISSQRAYELYRAHRSDRTGINRIPEMASVCLICGSAHVDPDSNHNGKFVCRNCGFPFLRYECESCGATVDSRDPTNPPCADCHQRCCTCGKCACG